MAEEQPRFYFAAVQQPDIVNTAALNGNSVSQPITLYTINDSVATQPLEENNVDLLQSPNTYGISCTSTDSSAATLSGEFYCIQQIQFNKKIIQAWCCHSNFQTISLIRDFPGSMINSLMFA